jgi:hypothetical protein
MGRHSERHGSTASAYTAWVGLLALLPSLSACASGGASSVDVPTPREGALIADYPAANIGPPPDSLGLDSLFYRKYTDAAGIPIVSSARVPDAALLVARDIVVHMVLDRPDLRQYMVGNGQRVGVMSIDEVTTDMPEQRDWKKPAYDDPRLTDGERERYYQPGGIASMTDREYWARRARGMGGRYTTGAEENVLGYPGTRYFGENILVHEFSHAIHRAIRNVDPELAAAIQAAYDDAMDAGRFPRHYGANTVAEYWAEGTQWWFGSNYEACFDDVVLYTPEDLAAYDPALFRLLGQVYPDHRIPMDAHRGLNVRSCRDRAAGR